MKFSDKGIIKINKIVLIKSNFKKKLEDVSGNLKNELDVDIEIQDGEPKFYVTLMVKYKGKIDGKELMNADIKMRGEFEIAGEKPAFYTEFCKVNAPAIIYPYVREHLASLTNKADLVTINLPTFNFVVFGQKYIESLKKQKKINSEKNSESESILK